MRMAEAAASAGFDEIFRPSRQSRSYCRRADSSRAGGILAECASQRHRRGCAVAAVADDDVEFRPERFGELRRFRVRAARSTET